jgi:PIN domain nuclease of toxin-antitoxin system
MNYLLDSHTLIWAILNKSRLSTRVRKTLEDRQNKVLVSSVTFWEISLKYALGKLELHGVLPEELPEVARTTGFDLIPLSPSEGASYYKLGVGLHGDPFDRMLVWQAIQQSLILITKDKTINKYHSLGLKTMW